MRLLILYHTALLLIVACPIAAQVESNTKGTAEKKASPAAEKTVEGMPQLSVTEPNPSASIPPGDIFSEQERAEGMDPFVSEKKRKADAYFKRGVVLYEGGDFASAAEAFQVAYETLPHPAVLGNIAMCYDSAGKIPEAVTYYRRYFEAPVPSSKNDFMEDRLAALSDLVSDLRIHCERSCEIRVDGISRGTTAVQTVVMPGTHRVEGVVDGQVVSSDLITVQARQIKAMSLALPDPEPEVEPAPVVLQLPPPLSVEAVRPRLRAGFWFSSGMTVVSLSLVTAFGTMTLNEKEIYRSSGFTDSEARDKGERYKAVTNAMVGIAGASAVAALLFAITDLRGSKKSKERDRVEVSPGPGAGVAVSF